MPKRPLDLTVCYSRAWSGFKKAWLALCLLSALIVIFEIIPRIAVNDQWRLLKTDVMGYVDAAAAGDDSTAARLADSIQEQCLFLIQRLVSWLLYLFPLAALVTVLLLMRANAAAGQKRDGRLPLKKILLVAVTHVVLSVLKLAAFVLLIVPGVYLYVKLLFVSLLMLEDGVTPARAVRKSWQLTTGHFFPLLLLVTLNTLVQLAASLTVIGLIPATGFVNTARAAAMHELKKN